MNALTRISSVQRQSGRLSPRDNLYRVAAASVVAASNKSYPGDVLRTMFPEDRVSLALIERSAVSPTTTSNAAALVGSSVADFVSTLPQSAASRLISASMRLDLQGRGTVSLPGIVTPFVPAFVDESGAIPVAQLNLADNDLGPAAKMAIMTAYTLETAKHTNVENLVRVALAEAAGTGLDGAVFSTAAATSSRPAGLLNGVSAITASAASDPFSAVIADLQGLVAEISAAGGNLDDVVFIAAPAQSVFLKLLSPPLAWPVFTSNALASGTLVAVAASGFVSAFGAEPRIEASQNPAVHFDDAATALSTDGVVASPIRSAFQSGIIVLRCILDCAWTTRAPGLVQFVTGTNW